VLAKQTLHAGPQVYGIVSALFGGGALLGALLAASLGRASFKVMLIGGAVFTGAELVLSPARSVAIAGLLLFVGGAGFTLWTANANTSLQLRAPDHLRGRVVGLYFYAFNGTAAFGGMLLGWLTSRGGTGLSFAVSGGLGLAATFLTATRLRRQVAARPAVEPAAAELREAA
jgi:MFS family permease